MDITIWFNMAVSKTGALNDGVIFCLKDLYDGVDWAALSIGDRQKLGKYFKNEVLEEHVPNVVCIGRQNNSSTKYRKG